MHEPQILFDEPALAGVDVELRREMWRRYESACGSLSRPPTTSLKPKKMADRIGVINKGEIILVEDKASADATVRPEQLAPARKPHSPPRPPR